MGRAAKGQAPNVDASADHRPAPPPPPQQAPVDTEETTVPAPPQKRLKIYNATVQLRVPDTDRAEQAVLKAAADVGGYLASKSKTTVTLRVPVEHFFSLMERIKGMGELLGETISVRDVTAQAYELQLRLDTAQKAHARLAELLAKAEKVEDLLKIEAEMRRLTEEIEVMKGQLRLLLDQVSMSTLTVQLFRSGPPPHAPRQHSPFAWVNQVGPAKTWSMPTYDEPRGFFVRPPLDVPERFLAVGENDRSVRALSSEESRLWVRTFDVSGGDLDFWEKALRKDLAEGRGLSLSKTEAVTMGSLTGRVLKVQTKLGPHDVHYTLAFFRRSGFWGEEVIVIELASKAAFAEDDAAAVRSAL